MSKKWKVRPDLQDDDALSAALENAAKTGQGSPGITLSPTVKEIFDATFPRAPEHAWDMSPEDFTAIEQMLAAMVDARLASLARRVDLLYRYTVGDRAGGRYMVPNMHQRGDEFPEAEP